MMFYKMEFGGTSFIFKAFIKFFIVAVLLTSGTSAARRRISHDFQNGPTTEALYEIAQAVGAAKFEEMTVDALAESSVPVAKFIDTNNPEGEVEYDNRGTLITGVMGKPGVDFPVFPTIPRTSFDCKNAAAGYYADLETDCQVFHICEGGRKISFLCPNGTIFRQSHLICDWWFKVDCEKSPELYEESAEHLAADQKKRERSNKRPSNKKNFDTIYTSQKQQEANVLSGIQSSNEYKAEASFTSVAQTARKPESASAERKQNSRRVQNVQRQPVTNSRTSSSFESFSKNTAEENNEKQRKANENSFQFSSTRRSMSDYVDTATYRDASSARNSKETQVAAESASFASNRGKSNYYQYSTVVDSRTRSTAQPTVRTTRPTYTTSYVPGTKNYVEVTRSVSQSVTSTKRPPSTLKHTISSTFRASTESVPIKKENNNVSYSFVQYNQYPTTIVPHNHYQITTNHTIPRKGKAFAISQKVGDSSLNGENLSRNIAPLLEQNKNQNIYNTDFSSATSQSDPNQSRTSASNWYESSQLKSTLPTYTTPSPTYASSVNEPSVSEHAIDMLKTLEELDLGSVEPTTETEKYFGRRPGLVVPPSAGPNTLHSLAIYFATAVDNLVSTLPPTVATDEADFVETTQFKDDQNTNGEENKETLTSLLSRNTLEKYTDLFKNSTEEESYGNDGVEEDLSNDLDLSQTRGPLTSSPQIRELAQVFTHALSAYLQDPETFRKVLSEIRPTDPTPYNEVSTTASTFVETTTSNDYSSVTKEEDEVLDFSDVSKISSKIPMRSTLIPYESNTLLNRNNIYDTQTTVSQDSNNVQNNDKTPGSQLVTHGTFEDLSLNEVRRGKELNTGSILSTSNPVAQEINGGLTVKNEKVPQSFGVEQKNNSNDNFDINSSYFPIKSEGTDKTPLPRYGGFQNNSSDYSSPYGAGVRPNDSLPITTYSPTRFETDSLPLHWGDTITTRSSSVLINPSIPSQDLLPPGGLQQNNKLDSVEMTVLNSFEPEDLNNLATFNKSQPIYVTEFPTEYSKDSLTTKQVLYNEDSDIYKSDQQRINDNDEQLQRAHSQSFVSSKNQIGRRGKHIKTTTNKNDQTLANEKTNGNETFVNVRTSTGLVLSLPTLKDILSRPTSLSHTSENKPSQTPTEIPTTTIDETTVSTLNTEGITTVSDEIKITTETYPKTSSKPQGSTSQYNIWSTSGALGHLWQTTVFLDPMTINDGLTGDLSSETIQPSANTYFPRAVTKTWNSKSTYEPTTVSVDQTDAVQYSTYTTPASTVKGEYTTNSIDEITTYHPEMNNAEPSLPSHAVLLDENEYFDQFKKSNQPTAEPLIRERGGKAISTFSNNVSLQKLNASDVDVTMMSKAKEMFGGLNASSATTLMNVMKQADRNTTVRRLILLLIQTCDDDHNKTIEASRTALLDALIRLPIDETEAAPTQNSIKDNLEVTGEHQRLTTPIETRGSFDRRSDEDIDTDDTKRPDLYKLSERRSKSFEEEVTTPLITTTEKEETTTMTTTTTTTTTEKPSTTTSLPVSTTRAYRRGSRKYVIKSSRNQSVNSRQTFGSDSYSSAEKGSTVSLEEQSVPSDTRALELLRSLYSLASRWG